MGDGHRRAATPRATLIAVRRYSRDTLLQLPTPVSARRFFIQGCQDILPVALPIATWSLVTGIAMANSPLQLHQAIGYSLLVYAGTAQLAALPLLVAGAPIWVSVMTALMVNLRFIIYSASLRPSFRAQSLSMRYRIGYLISDMAFIMYMREEARWRHEPLRAYYFLGLALANYVIWHIASLIGLVGGALIPEAWGLAFAGTLALVTILVPMLVSPAAITASVVAGVTAVCLRGLPFKLGLIVAIVSGVIAAVLVEKRAVTHV